MAVEDPYLIAHPFCGAEAFPAVPYRRVVTANQEYRGFDAFEGWDDFRIAELQRNAQQNNFGSNNISFARQQGDGLHVPIESGKADEVVCVGFDGLEDADKRQIFAREVARILRPNQGDRLGLLTVVQTGEGARRLPLRELHDLMQRAGLVLGGYTSNLDEIMLYTRPSGEADDYVAYFRHSLGGAAVQSATKV